MNLNCHVPLEGSDRAVNLNLVGETRSSAMVPERGVVTPVGGRGHEHGCLFGILRTRRTIITANATVLGATPHRDGKGCFNACLFVRTGFPLLPRPGLGRLVSNPCLRARLGLRREGSRAFVDRTMRYYTRVDDAIHLLEELCSANLARETG